MSRISRNAVLHALWFALAITIFSSLWLVVMTGTGWYSDPDRMEIALAIPIVEVILLVLASRQARRDGCTILATVALCLGITLAAATLSAGFAYAYTANQSDYFTSLNQAHAEGLRRAGKSEAEIATMVANHQIGMPKGFALNRFRNMVVFGVIGTLAGAAVAAIRKR
jgi:Protein of unknown function (DUF4199)